MMMVIAPTISYMVGIVVCLDANKATNAHEAAAALITPPGMAK